VLERFQRDVYCLLGLPFDAVDVDGAVRHVRDAAASRIPFFVSTPNLNFVVGSRTDRDFRDSVICSDFSIADGMPLIWVARLLRVPIHMRVAGSSVFEHLENGTSRPLRIYFFGGLEGVAATASARLNAKPSGLVCAGFEYPGFGSVEEMSSEETIARINASGAHCLFISLGAKKGQAWIERNRARISVPVICQLGAVLNFAAGIVLRAPLWMQTAGLEWMWRIKEEPRLWWRYFPDGLVFLRLLVTRVAPFAWFMLWHKPTRQELDSAGTELREEGSEIFIRLRGAWARENLGPLRDCFSAAVLLGKNVRLEMRGVTFVDSAFVGLVLLLQGHQTQHGSQLRIVSLPKPVRRVIKYCCAEYLCSSTA
jgi:N-acetylglucosaminyldiphosphoundecaprenol N-acetyl-beta-D-mannosaminyltransferase